MTQDTQPGDGGMKQDTQRYRDLVGDVRSKNGELVFFRHPETAMLWVRVTLPIPGVQGMGAFGEASVREDAEEHDPEARESAAVAAYRAARAKLCTMGPEPEVTMTAADVEYLKALSIGVDQEDEQ